MIIEIKDAPKMKNIKLDISFEDDGEQVVSIVQTPSDGITRPVKNDVFKDSVLDLDESFEPSIEEIIEKPVIEETEREVLVSDDMQSATF